MILSTKLAAVSAGLVLTGLSTAPIVSATYTVQANGTTQSVALLQQGSTVYVPLKDAAQWAQAKAQVNLKTHQIIWTTARKSSSPKAPTTAGVPLSTWPKALILANYTPKWTAITPKHPLVLNNGTTVTEGISSGIMYAGDNDNFNPRVLTQYATYVLNGNYQSLSFSAGIPNAVKNNDGTVTISIAIGKTVQAMTTVKSLVFTSGDLPSASAMIPLDHATLLRVTFQTKEAAYYPYSSGGQFYNSLGIALVNPMLIPYPTH